MSDKNKIQLYEDSKIRTLWDANAEKWYISIVDVIAALTESIDPTAYWRKLKQRLKAEGNQTVTNCHGLKMIAADGKMRKTDVAKVARKELESRTGKKVISSVNAKNILPENSVEKLKGNEDGE